LNAQDSASPRVLIVAENASARFGGESILPLHYFRKLRKRGVEVWMVVHARTRDELTQLLGDDIGRVSFIPDTWLHRFLGKLAKPLPGAIKNFTIWQIMRLYSQVLARRIARRIIAEKQIDIVHQPTPVSPKEVSLFQKMGVPVVIGPMNGGMTFPPGFQKVQSRLARGFVRLGRSMSSIFNHLVPGKLRAATLLVANQRTANALPAGVCGRVVTLVENGVDLELWKARPEQNGAAENPVRFVFAGRFDTWKGVDLLLHAFKDVADTTPCTLDIIGDGKLRGRLQEQARNLEIADKVKFHGWIPQAACAAQLQRANVFVLPSLFECGGAVVLEAMASGLPVVATNWGGPADYIDESCGILVDPDTREGFIAGLAAAMSKLARDSVLRRRMGMASRQRAVNEFDWERKIDRIVEIYRETVRRAGAQKTNQPVRSSS